MLILSGLALSLGVCVHIYKSYVSPGPSVGLGSEEKLITNYSMASIDQSRT